MYLANRNHIDAHEFRGFEVSSRYTADTTSERGDMMHDRGETRLCFLKITPAPAIHTHMVDRNIWEISRYVESGAGTSVMQHHEESQ